MRARLVVFPVKGRNWCFSRSIEPSVAEAASAYAPNTLKELWKNISSSNSNAHNAELVIDFVSNKMNRAWVGLEKAPEGTLKNKLHGLGLKLLSRVKPSEIFLKSISKEVTDVEIIYPSSLNPRLVRRRLRHVALSGSAIHKKYFYSSVSLLPLTSAFMVLPLPNIPFFWVLFRAYSHWRALQGSEKLLELVSDSPHADNLDIRNRQTSETENGHSEHEIQKPQNFPWVLQPSKDLEKLLNYGDENNGLSKCGISNICKTFHLNTNDVLRFKRMM
ncbi:uncharacterized protein C23H3.12c [Ricinus communis]|uniref:Uncharacterized protein n=1 Tax=Ricinus communis TaxID=3988 RepID=B9T507_RICCO|nr:uncharacterized protein C23H3.12c [Ricinus communis]EEF29062.1 conserved hypothetical protein [Ricinus communis]|eukprot:XP_002533326.1 uncharacterized protein C23H3.12c [Ricinus communis]